MIKDDEDIDKLIMAVYNRLIYGVSIKDIHDEYIFLGVTEEYFFLTAKAAENLYNANLKQIEELSNG